LRPEKEAAQPNTEGNEENEGFVAFVAFCERVCRDYDQHVDLSYGSAGPYRSAVSVFSLWQTGGFGFGFFGFGFVSDFDIRISDFG